MTAKIEALLFDLDGTLASAGQVVSKDIIESLASIKTGYKKHLITGACLDKIEQQISPDVLLSMFSRIYACNGTRVYNCDLDMDDENLAYEPELLHKVNLGDHYSEADINHIINVLLRLAANTHTKIKTGTFVDWRESQINFSVIGRDCTTAQRENYVEWDQKSGERRKIIDHLRKEFAGWGLSFRMGGQISIDISREGWDKSYAFMNMQEYPDQCVFFGDQICKDGNDLDVAMRCAKYHDVQGPSELLLALQEYQ
jgi:phosphomannomutase